jgi:dTDP-4-dehydrorhamnose 3,5-epimerase-like enzyme
MIDKELLRNVDELDIPDVKLIVPKRFVDARGYFSETWSSRLFRERIENLSPRGNWSALHADRFSTSPWTFAKVLQHMDNMLR